MKGLWAKPMYNPIMKWTKHDLRVASIAILLTLGITPLLSVAQEKLAEGEYQVIAPTSPASSAGRATSHWVLLNDHSGHFRLESEILNQRFGMRVIQIEYLDDALVPVAIGYDFYRKDDQTPSITAMCNFSAGSVVCTGRSAKDEAAPNAPYKASGPFWMWIEGLSSFDLPWLFDGGVNLAHLDKGSGSMSTLIVSGGSGVMIGDAINIAALQSIGKPLTVVAPTKPIPWSFRSAEESSLNFVGLESAEIQGTKVAVKHYTLTAGKNPTEIWVTKSGLLTKLALANHLTFVLSGYKQSRQIVTELGVEKTTAK